MSLKPLCFVLMPFGQKKDPSGRPDIDFDRIYTEAIEPGIQAAGMLPIRADEERTGGIIHRAMFERLLLCDFAVADLTTANANVFYELGVRHAVRPSTTLSIFATQQNIPFDVNYLRSLPYDLGKDNQFGTAEATQLKKSLQKRLTELRELARKDIPVDSPIFQLLQDYKAPDIARLKTDTFREHIRYTGEIKQSLAEGRRSQDLQRLKDVEKKLGELDQVEAGIAVDLFLSYRALEAWDEMI
ncbi:MAG: TRAFs-binding domain-containing protein, partial [bacterium]